MFSELKSIVNNEELIGTIEYPTLYKECRTNRCRYNRVRLDIPRFEKGYKETYNVEYGD